MARYKNITSGAVVDVREDKVLDSQWKRIDKAEATGYDAMKVADLKAEIDKRNDGRDDADLISSEGNKAALIEALQADDSATD